MDGSSGRPENDGIAPGEHRAVERAFIDEPHGEVDGVNAPERSLWAPMGLLFSVDLDR